VEASLDLLCCLNERHTGVAGAMTLRDCNRQLAHQYVARSRRLKQNQKNWSKQPGKYDICRFVPAMIQMVIRRKALKTHMGSGEKVFRQIRHKAVEGESRPLRLRPFFVTIVAVVALFTFAACGSPSNVLATKPSGTPTAGDILARAHKAHLTDETFTISMKGTSDGDAYTMTGTGKATENPPRTSMSLTMQIKGTTVTLDQVVDGTDNTTYSRITAPAQLAQKTWEKQAGTSDGGSGSDMLVGSIYDKVSNAKLIGSEQVNGVATWHIQGTLSVSDGDETVDIFVNQSDYLPAKMVVDAKGTDPVNMTLIYTAVNSGISIEIPTA
jgi:hypothetical protein